jgi:flagellar hook assembly protein FlgD
MRFSFSTPDAGRVELAIVDAAGRRVASVLQAELPAGSHFAGWDGRRSDGKHVAPGIYWAALESNGRQVESQGRSSPADSWSRAPRGLRYAHCSRARL